MGYNNDSLLGPLVFDIETTALSNAADYLEPVQAARNLKDPEKVRADLEQRTAERDSKLALDWNTGRIAVVAWWTAEHGVVILPCADERVEAEALRLFWVATTQRVLVGFNCLQFDLRFLIQRSRYLGVPAPQLELGRYGRSEIRDLYLELTFREPQAGEACMRRTLPAFVKRFGLDVPETCSSADIPVLVAAGHWESVLVHVRADVEMTLALARRLGVVQPEAVPA